MPKDSGSCQPRIIPEELIHETLAELLFTLDYGSQEDILRCHNALLEDSELYLAVWGLLDAPFRRMWSGALEDALSDLDRETGRRLSLPSAD